MMQPMDPMGQYDPGTAALIAKQTMPHASSGMVPLASPLDGIAKVAQQMLMQQAMKRRQQQGQASSLDSPNPASTPFYSSGE